MEDGQEDPSFFTWHVNTHKVYRYITQPWHSHLHPITVFLLLFPVLEARGMLEHSQGPCDSYVKVCATAHNHMAARRRCLGANVTLNNILDSAARGPCAICTCFPTHFATSLLLSRFTDAHCVITAEEISLHFFLSRDIQNTNDPRSCFYSFCSNNMSFFHPL